MLVLLLPLLFQDTLRLDANTALARAVERAPTILAAAARTRASAAAGSEAGRLRNPQLAFLAENLGAQRQVTGADGLRGIEGQVTLQGHLPIGGDLGAARRGATAQLDLATADAAMVEQEFRGHVLLAIATHDRSHALLREATAEANAMATFSAAMTARATEGRSSDGEAARTRTEAVMAASHLARRRADVASADAVLAASIGLTPGTLLRVTPPPACVPSVAGEAIAVQQATAKITLADALADQAAASRIPDLAPIVGLRRSGTFSGLLLGLSFDLPFFSTGGGSVAAARAEAESARSEATAVSLERDAAMAGARQALRELDVMASQYGATWESDLSRAVAAAEARWREGQGTLAELFDARRARVAAREEHAVWQLRRIAARIALARASGDELTTSLLMDECTGAAR